MNGGKMCHLHRFGELVVHVKTVKATVSLSNAT